MKKITSMFLALYAIFASCTKEPPPLTKTEVQRRIDSITTARIKELDDNAKKDLELRITIEVSVKADSILNAKLQARNKDTAPKLPLLKHP